MKSLLRFCLSLAVVFAISLLTVNLSSCDEDTLNALSGDCSGCPSSTPWSKPGESGCYATQAECENALGSGCVLCD